MIESLLLTSIRSFVIGLIMGIINGWNKKVMFFIWLMAVVIMAIIIFFVGEAMITNSNWNVWNWIFMLIFVNFGATIGYGSYKITFEEDRRN